ncbi:formylglycine-generating enzyme family protein [Breznakiellaceae bacterium SP9]
MNGEQAKATEAQLQALRAAEQELIQKEADARARVIRAQEQLKAVELLVRVLQAEEQQVRQKLETLNRQIALEKAEKASALSPPEDLLFAAVLDTQEAAAVQVPPDMLHIAGGTFLMGSSSSEPNRDSDEVQHRVTLSSFCMGTYPVTQKDYQALMKCNPSRFKEDALPVEQVNWYDAIDYCNARSKKEGLAPAYTVSKDNVTWSRNANGYRLPTEAEWEYACRAGTMTPFSTGNTIMTSQANYNGNYPYNGNVKGTYRGKTTPVGNFAANAWGLYDMHGNVWEWCWDWYGAYSSANQTDPIGAASVSFRVIRGGGWGSNAAYLRSASRSNNTPTDRYYGIGFRIVRP